MLQSKTIYFKTHDDFLEINWEVSRILFLFELDQIEPYRNTLFCFCLSRFLSAKKIW